ncbi:MAG: hypothetical protein KKB39_00155 [Nanoarchaeota archaeon]|nr:hypothetical protein [Nanoarchaeota archaeon]
MAGADITEYRTDDQNQDKSLVKLETEIGLNTLALTGERNLVLLTQSNNSSFAQDLYKELVLQLCIPDDKIISHTEALEKARKNDLEAYKTEHSWFKRAYLAFIRKSPKPKNSKKTKLLESIVAMENEISQGHKALAQLSENFNKLEQKYKGLVKERTQLKEKLRRCDAFFEAIEQDKRITEDIIDFYEGYVALSDEERETRWGEIQRVKNLDSELFYSSVDLESHANRISLLDRYKSKRFELENVFKVKKLELAYLKPKYKSLENQFALLLQQWQQSQELVNPGFMALSDLKIHYDVIDQCSEISMGLLDIDNVIKNAPKLIADANKAYMEVQEQLEIRTCENQGRIKVSSDLDGELMLSSLELGNPREEIAQLLREPSAFEEIVE